MSIDLFNARVCADCKCDLFRGSKSGLCAACHRKHKCVVCDEVKRDRVRLRWCDECEAIYNLASAARDKHTRRDKRSEAERRRAVTYYAYLVENGKPLFGAG